MESQHHARFPRSSAGRSFIAGCSGTPTAHRLGPLGASIAEDCALAYRNVCQDGSAHAKEEMLGASSADSPEVAGAAGCETPFRNRGKALWGVFRDHAEDVPILRLVQSPVVDVCCLKAARVSGFRKQHGQIFVNKEARRFQALRLRTILVVNGWEPRHAGFRGRPRRGCARAKTRAASIMAGVRFG